MKRRTILQLAAAMLAFPGGALREIGATIPRSVLLRADRVIE
jgi:hypothetical protein